ncbi:MAG: MFS transporter [Clostridia bacterium]|nr:MFS transporter [Clostridia bacterium]
MKNKLSSNTGLVIFLCWIGYSVATFGRINLTANIVNFTNVTGVPKTEFGAVGAAFAIAYGVGQLVNGVLCERLNSRWILSIALILSGGISVVVGCLKSIVAISIFWGLNGAIQSMLWCHVIKSISSFGDSKSISKGLVIITTTTPVGTIAAYGVSALFTFLGAWRLTFFVSGGMLVLSGVLIALFLPAASGEVGKKLPISRKNSSFVAFLPSLIPMFICAILLNYANHGLTTWMPNLLNEYYDMPEYFSILLTMLLPVVGMLCGITAVKSSERIGNPIIASILFSAIAAVGVVVSMVFMRVSVVFLMVGFVVGTFGAHVDNSIYTAVLPSSLKGYLGSGMLAGVIDAFCYVGTALSSQLPAILIEKSGYESFLASELIVCLLFAVIGTFANVMLNMCKRRFDEQKK